MLSNSLTLSPFASFCRFRYFAPVFPNLANLYSESNTLLHPLLSFSLCLLLGVLIYFQSRSSSSIIICFVAFVLNKYWVSFPSGHRHATDDLSKIHFGSTQLKSQIYFVILISGFPNFRFSFFPCRRNCGFISCSDYTMVIVQLTLCSSNFGDAPIIYGGAPTNSNIQGAVIIWCFFVLYLLTRVFGIFLSSSYCITPLFIFLLY